MKNPEVKYKRLRLSIIGSGIALFLLVVVGRLYFLQIIEHEKYADYSRGQYFQKVQITQTRGKILDRNGTPLAISVPTRSVFAHPAKVDNKQETAKILSSALNLSYADIFKKLKSNKNFVWIKRKVSDKEFGSIDWKSMDGVSTLGEDKRFYPHGTLAARAIGFTGIDSQGLAGLEYRYDRLLRGERAVFIAKKDALGRLYGYADGRDPNKRSEIITTIDANIQFAAEKSIKRAYEKYSAKSAVAIVMAVKTGEILAMAEEPEFNPNSFASYGAERYKSISVSESLEPGSIFKIFTAASALDSGVASPEDKFDCENGRFVIGEETIREADGKKFNQLTFSEIVAHSSNIGAIKIAQRIGRRRFYDYIRAFGFGSKTGVDLPGEAIGLFKYYKGWSYMSLPSMSFGQEITATPIQLITAISAIGNGGVMVSPHIMEEVVQNGKIIRKFKAPLYRRVISSHSAKETIEMLRFAVTDGTGKRADLVGYDMAGKTGTAQKYDFKAKKYSKDRFTGSFMGLFPAGNPKFAILVLVDEPSGKGYGGVVAAPVVKEIAKATARTLGIPAKDDAKYLVNWAKLEEKYLKKDKAVIKKSKSFLEKLGEAISGVANASEVEEWL